MVAWERYEQAANGAPSDCRVEGRQLSWQPIGIAEWMEASDGGAKRQTTADCLGRKVKHLRRH